MSDNSKSKGNENQKDLPQSPAREIAGDNMRAEAYAPQERVTTTAKQLGHQLEDLMGHLQDANATARNDGLAAAQATYMAAIHTADSIDQHSVLRERSNVKKQLEAENLTPQERRTLQRRDADLHIMERAPGFARANYGLMLMRSGDEPNALMLLQSAAEKDPEMRTDKNFARQLKSATAEALTKTADGVRTETATVKPADSQPEKFEPAAKATQTQGSAAEILQGALKKFADVVNQKGDLGAAFKQLTPAFQNAIAKSDSEFSQTMQNPNKDDKQISEALTGRFLSRFYMAGSADLAGNPDLAKSKLDEAFQAIPPQFQKAYLQNADVVALASKLELKPERFPMAPDALLQSIKIDAPAMTEQRRTESGSKEDRLRPDQIFGHAMKQLQSEGLTESTKKLFEESIKAADEKFTTSDKQNTERLLRWLQTGKADNGVELTPKQRVELHGAVQNQFVNSSLGITYRRAYSNVLLENKQYASADKVHDEKIKLADAMPLNLYQAEMSQLAKDMTNPNLSREAKDDLGKVYEGIAGSRASKDDGLIFMPVVARKEKAIFYLSALDNENAGILQPDKAFALINETKRVEQEVYGVDLQKNPNADSTLRALAAKTEPILSEHLKSDKTKYDTFWTNGALDAGMAFTAFTAAGLIASAATRNPKYFAMALTADKTALNLGGKVVLASGTVALASAGRHYGHEYLTGDNESWKTSFIHGTAAVGSVAAIMGTRAQVNQILFRGATEEGALIRLAEVHGSKVSAIEAAAEGTAAAADSSGVLTVKQIGKFYTDQNIKLTAETQKFIAENAETIVVSGGKIADQAAFEGIKLGLKPVQATALAENFLEPQVHAFDVAAKAYYAPGRLVNNLMGASPMAPLDLATATSGQMRMRSFYAGYAQAAAGIGTYKTVTALDRKVDPETGKLPGYLESVYNANFSSMSDNTLVDALFLQTMFRDGKIATNYFPENANMLTRAKMNLQAPFNSTHWGTATGGYEALGKQAAYNSFASTVYDLNQLKTAWVNKEKASYTQRLIDKTKIPMRDQAAPGVRQFEEANNVVPHQSLDLTANTPGLQ